jgi:hypothetical protein
MSSAESSRLLRAIVLGLLGLCVASGAGIADVYLHRGVEDSASLPYVVQVSGRELATNIDLLSFAPDQYESVVTTLKSGGFVYVRQPINWSAIEPQRGAFEWGAYDQALSAFSEHGIQVLAVLAGSPSWARDPAAANQVDAPPLDVNDYAAFVQAFVDRYKDQVEFVQLWDLPNRADHWGGVAASPLQYSDLLANGFNASRTANADTKVVVAELDPLGDGALGADLRFLQGIYDTGRSVFFDVVAARVDGGSSSPLNRNVSGSQPGLSRAILFRELMERNGDDGKPVWLSHYGWDAGADGNVSREDQAKFMVGGIERAQSEWPWMGLMFAWSLIPNPSDPASAGYALLNVDRTATPAYTALTAYGTGPEADLAETGFVPMESQPIGYEGNWGDQHLDDRIFKTTSEIGATATLRFRGTGVVAYLRGASDAGPLRATLDGGNIPGWPTEDGITTIDLEYTQAQNLWVTLASGLDDGPHELRLTLGGPGQLTIGGIVVSRDRPMVWPIALLTIAALVLGIFALREIGYVVAMKAGQLQRRGDVTLQPPLPHMPDWRPTRRT